MILARECDVEPEPELILEDAASHCGRPCGAWCATPQTPPKRWRPGSRTRTWTARRRLRSYARRLRGCRTSAWRSARSSTPTRTDTLPEARVALRWSASWRWSYHKRPQLHQGADGRMHRDVHPRMVEPTSCASAPCSLKTVSGGLSY